MSLWVKICGTTSMEDALAAAKAGADAVGFVFAPSLRRVTTAQAAAIVPHLPAALEKIGVFVDASFEEIAATVEAAGLTGVQLHFNAAAELAAQLRARFGPGLRIVRVVHFRADSTVSSDHDAGPPVDAILVDSFSATVRGGTGQTFDWAAARKTLFQNAKMGPHLIAAGGLTPENVAAAIITLQPWGVDVVSGVEASPGRKDHAKVHAFIDAARAAAEE